MNNESFYEDLDFKYPEIAIALENGSGDIKMYIPVLMPFVDNIGDKPKSKTNKAPSKSNILNKGSIAVSSTISKNYITLFVPYHFGMVYKEDKFVVVFVAGDPNKPVVVGRYED